MMGCCGKAKQIVKGFTSLIVEKVTGKEILKYEFTDDRIRICQKCDDNYWIGKTLWCVLCKCFVPASARVKEKRCKLGKWKAAGLI